LVAFLAFASFAQSLSAEPASDAGSRAIQKGEEGVALYDRGKWSEALDRFREAEELYHSPVFVLYTARALRNEGRFLDARRAFQKLLAEQLAPSAPELWKQAQRDGVTELATLDANVPRVLVSVEGGSQTTLLTVDDRPVAPGTSLELDPGNHRAVATDGARKTVRDFTLAPGAREQRVVLKFPSHPGRKTEPSGETEPYLPGWIAIGVGGAAILTGGVVGILALNKKAYTLDHLPPTCRETTCPASERAEVEANADKARNLGTAADVLFVSGAAVAAVGAGLLFFAPSEEPKVVPLASPRGGGLRVRF